MYRLQFTSKKLLTNHPEKIYGCNRSIPRNVETIKAIGILRSNAARQLRKVRFVSVQKAPEPLALALRGKDPSPSCRKSRNAKHPRRKKRWDTGRERRRPAKWVIQA